MNDTQNETIKFSMKPNPFLYALEVTWPNLLASTAISGFPLLFLPFFSKGQAIVLLTVYVVLGLIFFIIGFATACCLTFLVTDKRAIIRSSFGQTTKDVLSIAIESVGLIEIKFYGATHGSVYLTYDKPSPCENSEDSEFDDPQRGPMRRARNDAGRIPIPIKMTNSIWSNWITNSTWPSRESWFGFYAFKDFGEFAKIISEQQDSVSKVKRDHDARQSWGHG